MECSTFLLHMICDTYLTVLNCASRFHVHIIAYDRPIHRTPCGVQKNGLPHSVKRRRKGGSYPADMVTWFIMTELIILTLSSMWQCLPITDFLMEHFSPIFVPAPTTQSTAIFFHCVSIGAWKMDRVVYLSLRANDCLRMNEGMID